MTTKSNSSDHALANILLNVIIPVAILSFLSKDPALQEQLHRVAKPWHIGPVKALVVALSFPTCYGIWHFAKTRKANLFSMIGLISVLLSGCLTLYLWNKNGTVKPHAGFLFGLKEASIPFILGIAILASERSATPLIRVFLYNDTIFDIPKIEARIAELSAQSTYESLLRGATRLFATSFFLSSLMNLCLTRWFFRGFNATAIDALETYNSLIAKVTGWAFAVVGVPIVIFLFLTLRQLLKSLGKLTGFTDEEMMLPR